MERIEAEKKAKKLVAQMSVEERASQLKYDAPAIKRLGVPAYNWWNEALHGIARAGVATIFPQAIGLAAIFDEGLLKKIADSIATEGRAKYNEYARHEDRDIYKGLTFWSPNVNIFRDPRWGRGHETYGEDPYLSSRLGVAFVKGLQGEGEYLKSAACAKHFAVHSGPEALRHEFNAVVSKKDIRETYLPAFEACVKEAKVESVMGAYNRTNGEACCASQTLMNDILRGEWGFAGHYVSDCWAIKDFHEHHFITKTPEESAALALKSGCDLNCGNTYLQIMKAYQKGLVSEADITKSAERLFTTRYLLGLFESSEFDTISYKKIECKEHLELAEDAARKGIVLLKNKGILPIDKKKINTIGVIGPNANSRSALIGNYHGTSSRYITILEGIQDEVADEVTVLYSEGCDLSKDRVENLAMAQDRTMEAVSVAEHSDIVVLCIGLNENLEGEEGDEGNNYASGDKKDLFLPPSQQQLVEKILKVGRPTVVCLMAGSAIDLNLAEEYADAVMQLWYPGARGGKSTADILFGKCSPSGKLPITFYKNLEQLPPFEDYSMKRRTYRYLEEEALYPFGYGLTYGDICVTAATISGGIDFNSNSEDLKIEADIINNGTCATDDIIQIYIKDMDSKYAVKNHNLCSFKRIFLEAGEKKKVELKVSKAAFTIVDENGDRYIDSKKFILYVGVNQPDSRSVKLSGKKPIAITIDL